MTRGRKPKNPADFGKQFEELKKTIPAEKEHSPEVEAVGKAMEAFCQNPNKETEKELFEKSRELGRAIGGGITIFGDRETTEKVVAKLGNEVTYEKPHITTADLIAKIKQTLVAVCGFCTCDVEICPETIIRYFNGGNASVEITYGTSDNYRHFKIKHRESDAFKFAELVEVLKEWRGE